MDETLTVELDAALDDDADCEEDRTDDDDRAVEGVPDIETLEETLDEEEGALDEGVDDPLCVPLPDAERVVD